MVFERPFAAIRASDNCVPHGLAQLLLFFDGTRTVEEIHQAFCLLIGQELPMEIVQDAIAQLDEAMLLDNVRSQKAHHELKELFRQQPFRPPALVDLSYPSSPQALADMLNDYGKDDDLSDWNSWHGRAIISPHIDYLRGGPVYSKVWQRAKTAVLDADLVIIFGTDHNGGEGTFTLTRLPYATPYGILPTDVNIIDKVVEAIGSEAAFAEELHHRHEHSIELTAVWLHHIYNEAGVEPKPMLPILIGSFHHFVQQGTHPANESNLDAGHRSFETRNGRSQSVRRSLR